MASKELKPEIEPEVIDLKIKPVNPKGLFREFINYAHINHGPNEFTIDFCDIPQPYDDALEKVKQEGIIDAPVRYRIVCTPKFVERFIIALAENYRKYEDKKIKESDDK